MTAILALVMTWFAPCGAIPLGTGAPVVAIESPMDYQVFQRQTNEEGQVLVRGRTLRQGSRVEAYIDARPIVTKAAAASATGWQPLAYDSATAVFKGSLVAPAGGFYVLRVRVMLTDRSLAEAVVPHVGVGEVFVVAGQSNATNYGEVRQETKSRMVVAFDGRSWRIADDPQPGVQDASSRGSFIPSFGDALYARYHVPVGIVAVGHGSTSVRQWLPQEERFAVPPTLARFVTEVGPGQWESDGTLFNGMMARIDQLGPHGFRAVLWHQGESDANQKPGHELPGKEYARLLAQIISESRRRAGWDLPWFVAQASYHSASEPASPDIRDAQRSLWEQGIALQGPDTDALGPAYRQNHGAGVHFNAEGLQKHGQLWAEIIEAYLDARTTPR